MNNPDFFYELYLIINTSQNNDIKRNAYFILGQIAKNCADLSATVYLLQKLSLEKEKELLQNILNYLAELYKPKELDTSVILKLTTHRNPLVRGAAFKALTNNENSVEDFLINKLNTTDKKDDIAPLLSALRYVGTAKSIPFIEKHLKNRSSSLKSDAINTLIIAMLRSSYTIEDIQAKTKVSKEFVQAFSDKLDELTRPG